MNITKEHLLNIYGLLCEKKIIIKRISLTIFTILIIIATIFGNLLFFDYCAEEEDIYYSFLEGKRILSGINPYERVLSGNLRENNKYATYFPLFYILSALVQAIGLNGFPEWLFFWRIIFLIFNIGIAYLIYNMINSFKLQPIAILGAIIWLFNRWTLKVAFIAHLDFLPIFFLILSLKLFSKYKRTSLLLFGISLALKQIGIFLIPLYLIWIWNDTNEKKIKEIILSAIFILIIPFLISLPFIVWNPEGFFKSILFSATREPGTHFAAPSLEELLGARNLPIINAPLIGILAKIPTLTLMAIVYFCSLKKFIGNYTSALFIMVIFINFNAVLFHQYICWVIPFIFLSICDMGNRISQNRMRKNDYDNNRVE